MEEKLIRKLKDTLSNPIDEESKVVYIMVLVRKLLERVENKYSLLHFYCHWSLHVKINQLSNVREILNKIAEEHKKGEISTTLDFINFGNFRREFIDFCEEKEFNLPTSFLTEKESWVSFRKLFIHIIEDCPLELDSKFKPTLIEKFSFKSCKQHENNGYDHLTISWEYKLVGNDGLFSVSSTEILNPLKRVTL